MGNKASRRKSSSDLPAKRRKKPSNATSTSSSSQPDVNGKQDKHISLPNLGGAVPYRLYDEEPKVKYNIYRSYRDLDNNKVKDSTNTVDFRIYRRSTPDPADRMSMSMRPQTLPRGFGRSKSAVLPSREVTTPNGNMYMDWERAHGAPTPDSEYGTLRSGRSSRLSKRSSIASSCGTSSSKLTQVAATDFPSTAEIKRKLAYFEEQFAKSLVQKYSQLPESDQLASLALAIRKRFGQTQTITLLSYMEGENVPSDLLAPQDSGKYVLCIPQALFHGIQHVRRDKNKNMKLWTSLASDIVMCIGIEAANELSRIYEYQIVLMYDDVSTRILANHAAECTVDYVRNNTYLDRNAAIQGVALNIPPNPDGLPKYLAVVIGDKEVKWELYDIFKKCGLRKEISLHSDELIVDPDEESMENDPWSYHYTNGAEQMLYGYRGQLIEWNFLEQMYELDQEDDEKYAEEAIWRPDDFHRLYMPYKRLIGRKVMVAFSKMPKKDDGTKDKLNDLLKTEFDGNEDRDEIQPVYRPLGKPDEGSQVRFSNMDLNNMDLSRAKLADEDLSGTSIQNSKLLLADIAKVEGANLKGADLSFSTLDKSLSPERIPGVVARHVAMVSSSPKHKQHPQRSISPRLQETNLDESLPISVIIEEEEPQEPTLVQQQTTNAMVSNSHGKIVPITQIIREKQQQLNEEEQQKNIEVKDEVDQCSSSPVSSLSSPSSGSVIVPTTTTLISHEKLIAEKKKRKAKRKQRGNEPINPALNLSGSSGTSSTDFNILEERRPARKAYLSRSTTFDQGCADPQPIVQVEARTVSASAIPQNGPQTVPIIHHHQPPPPHRQQQQNGGSSQSEEEKDVAPPPPRPSSAIYYADEEQQGKRSPSATRSFSSSNIDFEAYRIQENQLPPVRGSRVTSTLPSSRMVKSASHHGHLRGGHTGSGGSGGNIGFYPLSRRQHSAAEIEFIRRSQIFTMMKGLTIPNLEDNLPDEGPVFYGRDKEIIDITDLLSASGRVINVFGCSGVGKSALAISVAAEMKKKHITPVYVDCRGCITTDSVWKVIMINLELRFKLSEIIYFYNWVNSHEQRLLFLFDNLELLPGEDSKVSELLDSLMMHIKNLRILCTSDRNFFRGQTAQETYRVGAVQNESRKILEVMVPDLHEEGVDQLAASVDHVLLGLMICGRSFAIEDVDSGKLYEDITNPDPNGLPIGKLQDLLEDITSDEIEKQKLARVSSCVRIILDYFQPEVKDLLVKLSCTTSFNVECASKLSGMEEQQVKGVLDNLVNCHMLRAVTKHGGRFYIPKVVRLVLDTCWPDNGSNSRSFVFYFVQMLNELCVGFHSKNCREALDMVDADFDNIVDTLNRILEREDAFELCADFATPEFSMFLYEILPRVLFEDLYDSLVQQAEEQAAWCVQMYALCSLAYMHTATQELERAKICAERAYAISHKHGNNQHEKEKAQCMLCLGKVYWLQDGENKDKAVVLIKKALDNLKVSAGSRNLRTLYANEEYGYILTEKGSYQTARHFYNISDFIVQELLDVHPLLLEGYNCRRAIWDQLCLFARATEVAEKAANTARTFLGEHPMTATVLMSQCEAIMRRGSLNDALGTAVKALAIRIKVLGDCDVTAASYKTIAFLMMRSGQYDEAVRFAQSALDIYDKLDADSNNRLQIELKNLMAQCRFRLDCKATRFVELESKDASKKQLTEEWNSSMSSAVSTEV